MTDIDLDELERLVNNCRSAAELECSIDIGSTMLKLIALARRKGVEYDDSTAKHMRLLIEDAIVKTRADEYEQLLRRMESAPNYITLSEIQDWAREALEKEQSNG